jgi:hypothetical protein
MTKRPSHGAPRPTTSTTEIVTSVPDDDETLCDLCLRWPKWRDYSWCAKCIRDLAEALNRRRAAELRLPPLSTTGAS